MSEDNEILGKCHACDEDVSADAQSDDAGECRLIMHKACAGQAYPHEQSRGPR